MEKFKAFLRRKDIEISIKRYGIDALGAMAQGLFCSLLIGTIINTLGTQFHISFLTTAVATVNDTQYTVICNERSCHGCCHRLCAALSTVGVVFTDHCWLCI